MNYALTSTALGGLLALMPVPGVAGSYKGTAVRSTFADCVHGVTQAASDKINPQGIVHPVTFSQLGGSFDVKVCVEEGSISGLASVVTWAISIWNTLAPWEENCHNCVVSEEPSQSDAASPPVLASVVLHELGHCAMGLDHPDRNWDFGGDGTYEFTSLTRSWDTIEIDVGPDGLPGSLDDFHDAPLGEVAESVSWFRKADNDPVVNDVTTIELATFSRSVTTNLPAGHSWAANANRLVAQSLGHGSTQAVMYASLDVGVFFNGLAADDINMVLMQRTGVDLAAGTADDYFVTLSIVECSEPHDIKIGSSSTLGKDGNFGACHSGTDYAYAQLPGNARVYKNVVATGLGTLEIDINDTYEYNTAVPIFAHGFENGDLDAWSDSDQ